MGLNLMSGARRVQVMEQARKSVARDLRRLRGSDLLPEKRVRQRTRSVRRRKAA
jgi:hypothetical protein